VNEPGGNVSIDSIRAFQPFATEAVLGLPGARGFAGAVARRVWEALGRAPAHSVLATLAGSDDRGDVASALRRLLGDGVRLELRACDRLPPGGPVWILAFRPAAAAGPPGAAPNTVSEESLARIVRASGAPVLPALLLQDGGAACVRLGAPLGVGAGAASGETGDLAFLERVRERALLLRHRGGGPERVAAPAGGPIAVPAEPEYWPERFEDELAALPPAQNLLESGRFTVVQARAHQIPTLLRELGRLRELTFRAAGEGTGRALDLDAHDRSYRHLVLWDREARVVVGGYRFAPSDELIPVFGVPGLYTSTLFRFDPALFERLGPALELGRSFVRAEYQRTFSPLLLLWRGLCAFVARNPRYRTLFGAVSVAARYSSFSRELIVAALSRPALLHELAPLVEARTPLRPGRGPRQTLRQLADDGGQVAALSSLVADLEVDGKGLPVLLREYLRLGGRVLGFNLDPDFGNVLDALVAVDLRETQPRLLAHYMGRGAAAAFRRHHGLGELRPGRAA